jgi:hypothetical protein
LFFQQGERRTIISKGTRRIDPRHKVVAAAGIIDSIDSLVRSCKREIESVYLFDVTDVKYV